MTEVFFDSSIDEYWVNHRMIEKAKYLLSHKLVRKVFLDSVDEYWVHLDCSS